MIDRTTIPSVPGCYVLSDTRGRPLYVGSSSCVRRRALQHSKRSPWWPDVARVEIVPVPAGVDRWRFESELITRLRPVHNRQLAPGVAL